LGPHATAALIFIKKAPSLIKIGFLKKKTVPLCC